MYYEERFFDGVLHYRNVSGGTWLVAEGE